MSKKYKKTQQGDHRVDQTAPSSSRRSSGSGGDHYRLAALAATASDDQGEASSSFGPASRAVDGCGGVEETSGGLSHHLLMSLHVDAPLSGQQRGTRGTRDDAQNHVGGSDRARKHLPHPFGDGGGSGGGRTGANDNPVAPFPFSSLQQPPLPRPTCKDVDDGGDGARVALTRAFTAPEPSRGDGDVRRPDLLKRPQGGAEYEDLGRAYPLLLQRSASSAFGSPALGKFKCARSHSNSGNSDPGASAFHPVWSCKSLSTSSAGSDHSFNEVGASTRSDPAGDHRRRLRKATSPWRKVMARMKKGSSMGGKGGTFGRQLGGRENPARPDLGDDSEPDRDELPVVSAMSTMAVRGDDICRELLKMSFGGNGDVVAAARAVVAKRSSASNGSASSGSKKASRKLVKKDTMSRRKSASSNCNKESKRSDTKKESAEASQTMTKEALELYDDPGIALDLSESGDDDDNDDTVEPIMGKSIAWDKESRMHSLSRPPTIDVAPQLAKNGQPDHQQEAPQLAKNGQSDHKQEVPEWQHVRTPSTEVPCDSVEVIHRSPSSADGRIAHVMDETFGSSSVHVFSPATSIEENSPPEVECTTVEESSEKHDNFPYHPLGGDDNHQDAAASQVPLMLKYRSPQRTPQPSKASSSTPCGNNAAQHNHSPSCASSHNSPDSRLSSTGGSPASRISSSNSRANNATAPSGGRTINTLQTEGSLIVDGADFEVREANRSSLRGSHGGVETNQEVVASPDGNDTVVSSSTTSSNYHTYLSSPRPLRDGATMPVDRFFAGGNVAMSPSPQQRGMADQSNPTSESITIVKAPTISKFIALSPKKLSSTRISCGAPSRAGARDATHSPHTVSSNSMSANSSSSTETKKPLKFVAYEIQEEREAGSPYDGPPSNSMIKPRISNIGRHRPPMVQRTLVPAGYDPRKPPQSPRKQDHGRIASGARTPTRTPPPSITYKETAGSGANTPCSPPVIVDGPNVLCGDLSTKPKRPYVVRRGRGTSGRGMFLMPPSSASSYRPPHPPPIPPQPNAVSAAPLVARVAVTSSPLRDNYSNVVGEGSVDDAHGIIADSTAPFVEGSGCLVVTVSPDRHTVTRRLYNEPDLKENHAAQGDTVAIVSPEKGL